MTPEILTLPVGDDPSKASLYYGQTVLATLKELPSGSVQSIVTSPPYWSLRDYGTAPQVWGGDPDCLHEWGDTVRAPWANSVPGPSDNVPKNVTGAGGHWKTKESGSFCQKCGAWFGDLGLEPTPELYVEHMVTIFREARRVLRDDGTLWLNIGDSYSSAGGGGEARMVELHGERDTDFRRGVLTEGRSGKRPYKDIGLKPKDLIGIPWMCAFALRADGWYLRSEIIWEKNSMPESVTDRPTRSHEHIFLLSRKPHYFYDAEAIKEPAVTAGDPRHERTDKRKEEDAFCMDGGSRKRTGNPTGQMRNKRTIFKVNLRPYPGAHYAVMPPALAEIMILAGSSKKGRCSICGAPWERVVEQTKPPDCGRGTESWSSGGLQPGNTHQRNHFNGSLSNPVPPKYLGWEPTCDCPENNEPIPCTVLDPFSGSGTTGMVALKLGRDYIGIDLNPDFLPLARARIQGDAAPEKADSDLSESIFDLF